VAIIRISLAGSLVCKVHARYQGIRRKAIARSANPRPSSYPYISGDSFRALSNHIYEDRGQPLDALAVRDNDLVFVATHLVREFFDLFHPRIRGRYTLITHNSDENVTEELAALADEKLVAWYAQNLLVPHSKISPIPIGLENLHHYNNGLIKDFSRLRKQTYVKRNRILHSFKVATNPSIRQSLDDSLKRHPLVDRVSGVLAYYYRRILCKYKFVVSPPGNGIDCHRTWEAMYFGVVPIVISSHVTRSFSSYPIWIVEDWKELGDLREADLSKKYREIKNREFDEAKLFMNYWQQVTHRNVTSQAASISR